MSTRHTLRGIVAQTMYELDMNESLNLTDSGYKAVLKRNVDEFAPDTKDLSFAENLLTEVLSRLVTLDELIKKAAPEWPIEKINVMDRNILRVGLCELLFSDRSNVPPKVAIDEAIEIAKEFSGEVSGKFVNGVLGAVYKEMGEPNKDETSKKEIKTENLVGVVLFSEADGEKYIGMVHDIFGKWTICKSKITVEENPDESVSRIVKKEFGIADAQMIEQIGQNDYIAHSPEKGKVRKIVSYFIASSDFVEPNVEKGKGLDDAKWFKISEISTLPIYEDMRSILNTGILKIQNAGN